MCVAGWWTRSWIVQEVVVASDITIQWGNTQIEWELVVEAVDVVWKMFSSLSLSLVLIKDDSKAFIPKLGEKCMAVMKAYKKDLALMRYRKGQGESKLLDLLVGNWDRKSTDPRDKVFAFLQLATHQQSDSLVADYAKSMEEVFALAAKDILQRERNLDILAFARKPPGMQDSLPSWCPDWRAEAAGKDTGSLCFSDIRFFTPPLLHLKVPDSPKPVISHDLKSLQAFGRVLDSIIFSGSIREPTTVLQSALDELVDAGIPLLDGETYSL